MNLKTEISPAAGAGFSKRAMLAAIGAMLAASSANATISIFGFPGASFTVDFGGANPILTAASFTLEGKTFDLSNTGLYFVGNNIGFGGTVNGAGGIISNLGGDEALNDFAISIPIDMPATPPGPFGIAARLFTSTSALGLANGIYLVSRSNVDDAPAAVPEPASWAMFICGFGLIGATIRRRKVLVSFA
jgi:hypothetical protein